jgi:hypothetical protein
MIDADDERIEAWFERIEVLEEEIVEEGSNNPVADVLASAFVAIEAASAQSLAEAEARAQAESAALKIEVGALRKDLAVLRAELAAGRRRETEIANLRAEIARLEKERAQEAEAWRAELLLLSNELAEVRAIDRLRSSRAGRAHEAEVRMRLLRRTFECEATAGGSIDG